MARALLGVALLAPAALAQNVGFTIAGTSSGVSSNTIGINTGHRANEDSTWQAFMQRLGVNGARLFGGGGIGSDGNVLAVSANVSSWRLGLSTGGYNVTSSTLFWDAVADLSVPAAHTPSLTVGTVGAPSVPLPWARIETNLAFRDSSAGVLSYHTGTVDNAIRALQALGVAPLLVQQLGCGNGPDASKGMFTSMTSTDPSYWPQRWEIYKHGYGIASWAWRHSISNIELANEPDFTSNNLPCFCEGSVWLEFFLLRALAARNAYFDLNSDLAAGRATTANGLCDPTVGCPAGNVTLNILNSAFANTGWSGTTTTTYSPGATGGVCSSTYTSAYTGLNGATVALTNQTFPLVGGSVVSSWKNADAFSFHSYGAGGAGLIAAGMSNLYGVEAAAFPMPVHITEHARYTGATWDALPDNSDNLLAATRLGSQVISVHGVAADANTGNSPYTIPANTGMNAYIFKFSMTPYEAGSSSNLASALTSTPSAPVLQSGTGSGVTLGLTKSGIHTGDNNGGNLQPFSIGDTTFSGEIAALVIPALVGGKALFNCAPNVTYSNGGAPCTTGGCAFPCTAARSADGRTLDIVVVNDGSNSAAPLARAATFNVAALTATPSFVTISEVSNNSGVLYYGEVSEFGTGAALAPGGVISRTLGANAALKISIPLHAR